MVVRFISVLGISSYHSSIVITAKDSTTFSIHHPTICLTEDQYIVSWIKNKHLMFFFYLFYTPYQKHAQLHRNICILNVSLVFIRVVLKLQDTLYTGRMLVKNWRSLVSGYRTYSVTFAWLPLASPRVDILSHLLFVIKYWSI